MSPLLSLFIWMSRIVQIIPTYRHMFRPHVRPRDADDRRKEQWIRRMCWSSNHLLSAASIFHGRRNKIFPHAYACAAIYPANRWCIEGFSAASRAIKYVPPQEHTGEFRVFSRSHVTFEVMESRERTDEIEYIHTYRHLISFVFHLLCIYVCSIAYYVTIWKINCT